MPPPPEHELVVLCDGRGVCPLTPGGGAARWLVVDSERDDVDQRAQRLVGVVHDGVSRVPARRGCPARTRRLLLARAHKKSLRSNWSFEPPPSCFALSARRFLLARVTCLFRVARGASGRRGRRRAPCPRSQGTARWARTQPWNSTTFAPIRQRAQRGVVGMG